MAVDPKRVERILKELEGRYPKEVSPDDLSWPP